MGCAGSKDPVDAAATKRNRDLERQMEADFKQEQEKVKLLLLGPGESGKSTIFRQMKIIHGVISQEDQAQMTPVVYANTIGTMKTLVGQCSFFGYEAEVDPACEASMAFIRDIDDTATINDEVGGHIKALWADPAIQKTWARRSEYQVIESMRFFLENIDRIMASGYSATPQDILHVRIRSSGIVVDRYNIDGTTFEMYDVGGQRNERKKWIHCFDNVTAVIYVAALSEYDQGLFEDSSTNRMVEAIELFKEICNNPYFVNSSIILFLNKKDLFAEKVKIKSIGAVPHWQDFKGAEHDFDAGEAYFREKFMAANASGKLVYTHVTCATDTENVRVVFNSCKDTILRSNLKNSGFMD
ncbi:unnamed protein product [Phaeothamnion confervicola]